MASPGGGEEESSHAPPAEGVCSKKQSAVHEAVIKSQDETFQVGGVGIVAVLMITSGLRHFRLKMLCVWPLA